MRGQHVIAGRRGRRAEEVKSGGVAVGVKRGAVHREKAQREPGPGFRGVGEPLAGIARAGLGRGMEPVPGDEGLLAGQVTVKSRFGQACLRGAGRSRCHLLRAAVACLAAVIAVIAAWLLSHLRGELVVGHAGGQRQLVGDERGKRFPADRLPLVPAPAAPRHRSAAVRARPTDVWW